MKFFKNFLLILASLVVGTIAGLFLSHRFSPGDIAGRDATGISTTSIPVAAPQTEDTSPAGPDGGSQSQQTASPVDGIASGRQNAIVKAAETVGPCVVSINVIQSQIVETSLPFNDFWSEFFFPRRYRREIQSLGSGFVISGKGHILTNEHVVHNATKILVTLEDGREFEASVIGSDPRTDLALLRIEGKDLPVAPLGNSDDLVLGEWLIAIGNPFGYLLDDPKPTVTVGVVSALDRDIKPEQGDSRVFVNMIQTDASINPGNSGGPLIDSEGYVVGVNTFILTKSGGSLGMGFAVPINRASRVVKDLVTYGRVRWPWIGIHPQELTSSLREGLNITKERVVSGIIVADIEQGSPAEKAGISRGDIITELNGKHVRSILDWEGETTDVPTGEILRISILRHEKAKTIELKTEFLPTDVAKTIKSKLGIVLTDLSEAVKSQIGATSNSGAVVVTVNDSQLEEEGGILPFDVILKINNKSIESADAAVEALDNLQRGSRNLLVIEREGKLIYRSLITG